VAARLQHPHLVPLLSAGETRPFVAVLPMVDPSGHPKAKASPSAPSHTPSASPMCWREPSAEPAKARL